MLRVRALELRIKLRVELRAEPRVELRAEPRVELLSRAFEQSSVQSLDRAQAERRAELRAEL